MRINLRKPLNPDSVNGKLLLKDLQGNILQSHGRDHAMHLFINFTPKAGEQDPDKFADGFRNWINFMLATRITSAAAQRADKKVSSL